MNTPGLREHGAPTWAYLNNIFMFWSSVAEGSMSVSTKKRNGFLKFCRASQSTIVLICSWFGYHLDIIGILNFVSFVSCYSIVHVCKSKKSLRLRGCAQDIDQECLGIL